jgi:hypothetical protein
MPQSYDQTSPLAVSSGVRTTGILFGVLFVLYAAREILGLLRQHGAGFTAFPTIAARLSGDQPRRRRDVRGDAVRGTVALYTLRRLTISGHVTTWR